MAKWLGGLASLTYGVPCDLAVYRGAGCGKADFDVQAAAGLRADGERGGVGLGDCLDDGQAQAKAVPVAGAVCAEPLERPQEPVDGCCRHDGPGVDHRQDRAGTGFPSNRGDFLIAHSCNFAASCDYRTPVHLVAWRPLVCGGPVVTGCAASPGEGQAGPARVSCLRGRRGLRGPGRPQAAAQRCAAAWRPEGRPRTLARRVPRPGRGSPMVKVSGGEAVSFWVWAAQRPARLHAASFPASDRS